MCVPCTRSTSGMEMAGLTSRATCGRPGARRIDQHARTAFLGLPPALANVTITPSSRNSRPTKFRRHRDLRAQLQSGSHHRTRQQRIVGLRVVIADDGVQIRDLEAVELRPLARGTLPKRVAATKPPSNAYIHSPACNCQGRRRVS